MGNRHNIEVFTPHRIHPPEHPGLHFTEVDGRRELTPNLQGAVLRFGTGNIVASDRAGYTVADFEGKRSFLFELAPRLNDQDPEEFHTDVQSRKVVGERADIIAALANQTGNVIVVRHGRLWGLFPELAIAEALRERGFVVPQVFPKVGGRNRVQEHAVLILGNENAK